MVAFAIRPSATHADKFTGPVGIRHRMRTNFHAKPRLLPRDGERSSDGRVRDSLDSGQDNWSPRLATQQAPLFLLPSTYPRDDRARVLALQQMTDTAGAETSGRGRWSRTQTESRTSDPSV